MLYRLLSSMDRSRFDSTVISLRNSGDLRSRVIALGIPVYSLKIDGPLSAAASIWRLARLVRRTKPDIIQGWLPLGNLLGFLAGRLTSERVPVVWNIRQSLECWNYEKGVAKLAIRIGGWLSHKPAMIIYNSRRGANQYTRFGYRVANSKVVYNGFDTELFKPSRAAGNGLRTELGVDANTVLIGLIGRYHPVKNHRNFLRAAAELKKIYSNVEFVLCGSGITWSNHTLRRQIEDLELTSAIHLLGTRQDMPRVMAALDILASASHGEGFPNAIGEAMACAVPCVATDVSDVPWIIANAGIVIPKNDPASMARALVELIERGAQDRQDLGYRGRARVAEHFGLSAIAEQYSSIYEELLARTADEPNAAVLKALSDNYSDSAASDNISVSA
jgi:glycosyltransferase involved in cell wall biosynthesis